MAILVAPIALAQESTQRSPAKSTITDASPTDLPILRLDDLLNDVRVDNPSLRAFYLEAEALQTRRRQVSALPDPMVMGTYQPFPLMTARGSQRSQWRVEQTIPYPGKLSLQGDIAGLGAEVAGFEARTFEQDLVVQTKQLYFDLYRIQEQTALVRDFQDRLAEFERIAATQYEVGTGAQQAILKAQVEKNTLAQRLIELSERRKTVLESLSRVTNRPLPADAQLEASLPEAVLPAEQWLADVARAMRPEVDALAAAERRAQKQVELGHKQFLPDFGVNVTYFDLAASDGMPTATGRDALAIGVSVKVPLQRDRVRAQIEEAQARTAQVRSRQEALETSFSTQIADLTNQLRQEADQIALYRDVLLPQAETNVEATLSAYTTGRTDFLNLLDSERMLFQLRMGYEDAYVRYLKAASSLERTLGIESLMELHDADVLLRSANPSND